ncbi:MAG TPA: hypothetical protein VFD22_05325, partial [Gemmatimonadaceae bacterium]|nr:hypothetical protein [Gemmatimonadaceae bacterium]
LDLRPSRNLALATVFSRTWIRDYPLTTDAESDDLSVELSENFKLLRGVSERPSGRLFLRYQRQSGTVTPVIRALRQPSVSKDLWSLNSGVSLNAF